MSSTNGHASDGHAGGYRETAPDSLVGIRVQLAWLGTVETGCETATGLWWARIGRELERSGDTVEDALRRLWAAAAPMIASRLAKMPRPTPAEILGRGAVMLHPVEKVPGEPVAPPEPPGTTDPAPAAPDATLDDWRFGKAANIGVGKGGGQP